MFISIIHFCLSWFFGIFLLMLRFFAAFKMIRKRPHVQNGIVTLTFDVVLVRGVTSTSQLPWLVFRGGQQRESRPDVDRTLYSKTQERLYKTVALNYPRSILAVKLLDRFLSWKFVARLVRFCYKCISVVWVNMVSTLRKSNKTEGSLAN